VSRKRANDNTGPFVYPPRRDKIVAVLNDHFLGDPPIRRILRPYRIARSFPPDALRAAAGARYRLVRDRHGIEHVWTEAGNDPLGVALSVVTGHDELRPFGQIVAFRLAKAFGYGLDTEIAIWLAADAFNDAWCDGRIVPRTLAAALGVADRRSS
jgi:hypothetical protein